MLTTTEARDLLRAAIAERDEAEAAEIAATKAVVRGKQMLDEAEQTLATLASVESEINAHHAVEIKTWAMNGGERPSGTLPEHLASKRAFKVEVETKVAAARSVNELLSKELVAASGRLQGREEGVQRSAAGVLIAEANVIAARLCQARRVVWALETKLQSLCGVRLKTAEGLVLIDVSNDVTIALRETVTPSLTLNVKQPYTVDRERWQRYLEDLTQDPLIANPDSTLGLS
jgi:hypothetical protein